MLPVRPTFQSDLFYDTERTSRHIPSAGLVREQQPRLLVILGQNTISRSSCRSQTAYREMCERSGSRTRRWSFRARYRGGSDRELVRDFLNHPMTGVAMPFRGGRLIVIPHRAGCVIFARRAQTQSYGSQRHSE